MYLGTYFMAKDTNPKRTRTISRPTRLRKTYFRDDWYIAYDRLGDACKVDFPIRLEGRIKWSCQVFNSSGSAKPKVFKEMIYVTLVKTRC